MSIFTEIFSEDKYESRLIDISKLKIKSENNLRNINKTLDLIMKIEHTIKRSQLLIEKLFLNSTLKNLPDHCLQNLNNLKLYCMYNVNASKTTPWKTFGSIV